MDAREMDEIENLRSGTVPNDLVPKDLPQATGGLKLGPTPVWTCGSGRV